MASDATAEENPSADMRNILGYLNQNEWIQSLNIGNIMQVQVVQWKELLHDAKSEVELSRDSFLEKISMLAVSYFCVSTEIRFILQVGEEDALDPAVDEATKRKESGYWHSKSLEIACSFLPSECPLLNHILLSF